MRKATLTFLVFAIVLVVCAFALPVGSQQNETRKLHAEDGAVWDRLGRSVSISGDIAIVGAPHDDDNGPDSGSAYVFNTTTGEQLFKLLATDGNAGDTFGLAVAIDGNLAVVGANGHDDNGSNSGSAYVFDVTTGQQLFHLLATDGEAVDAFGISVAIDGTLAVISAIRDEHNGVGGGSAYIFDLTTGEQLFKLIANDREGGESFGASVGISGSTAIVGASLDSDGATNTGSAYVFDVTTGKQLFKLLASDRSQGDRFGRAVAVSGAIAVIGAPEDLTGSAYIFDVTTGLQRAKLIPSNGHEFGRFGQSVDIDGNLAVVGSPEHDGSGQNSGIAYVFDITTHEQLFMLRGSDTAAIDEFGRSVAIENGLAVIGAPNDDDLAENSGAAYVFTEIRMGTNLTSLQMNTGTLLDGTLDDLIVADDQYTHTRSGFGSSLVDLHKTELTISAATTVNAPNEIRVFIESRIDQVNGLATISLRDWSTNEFVTVHSYAIGMTDQMIVIENVDPTFHVSGLGDIEMSLKHVVFVPFLAFTFESFIDQVEIVVN